MNGGDMEDGAPWDGRAPVWFWAVAGLCLLWNVLAVAIFLLGDPARALPGWVAVAALLAVGGSLVGAMLMLARRRQAAVAYALSFAGAAAEITWHYAHGALAAEPGFAPRAVAQAGGILVQLWLSRRMFWLGALR